MTSKIIPSEHAMAEIGASFAKAARAGDVFALVGDLGAGKTCFSGGFIRELQPQVATSSPTFSIVNEYREGKFPIFHFDFYRLKSLEELIALGWDEYLDESGIVICEWADLFPSLIPPGAKWITIRHASDGTRTVEETETPPEP